MGRTKDLVTRLSELLDLETLKDLTYSLGGNISTDTLYEELQDKLKDLGVKNFP